LEWCNLWFYKWSV